MLLVSSREAYDDNDVGSLRSVILSDEHTVPRGFLLSNESEKHISH